MRPLLTRNVFRQLTYSALYTDSSCLLRSERHCRRRWQIDNADARTPNLTRSLFGFTAKRKKIPSTKYKPGFELMRLCKERTSLQERAPPSEDLAEAFVDFFKSQAKQDGGAFPLEDVQLAVAIPTFKHLRNTYTETAGFGISDEDLRTVLRALRSGSTNLHLEMAALVFEELFRRRIKAADAKLPFPALHIDLVLYIWVLCHNGGAILARDLVDKFWETDLKDAKAVNGNGEDKIASQWSIVLRGLIRERRNSEVEKTVDMMQNHNVPFDSKLHQAIVTFYAFYVGDIDLTKKWYKFPIADSSPPTSFTDATVLKLCIKEKELEWGDQIFTRLVERNPEDKTSWHIILQWCAANGKGVDEIENMMKVMAKRSIDRPDNQPGMDTINSLIEYANSKDDPYTAERYFALGQQWGFLPNAKTHLLQLDYRIKVKDLSGALEAYRKLQVEAPPESEDIPYINRLIVLLCTQAEQRYDTIMTLVEELRERKAPFQPQTVMSLAVLHITRDEMQDYSDLMNTFVHNFSAEQRMEVRDALLVPVFDKNINPGQAWMTYNIMQDTMRETLDRDLRVRIMECFFDRNRGDMGLHVFGHMRKDKDLALQPTRDIYIQCLVGLSKVGDYPAVQLVNNMMTMDETIEPNTKLLNALMMAYNGVRNFNQAWRVWQDVRHSREGPSYNSIRIVMKTCEFVRIDTYNNITDIRKMLKEKNIPLTKEIFAAYLGAMSSISRFDEIWDLLDNAKQECGSKADAFM